MGFLTCTRCRKLYSYTRTSIGLGARPTGLPPLFPPFPTGFTLPDYILSNISKILNSLLGGNISAPGRAGLAFSTLRSLFYFSFNVSLICGLLRFCKIDGGVSLLRRDADGVGFNSKYLQRLTA